MIRRLQPLDVDRIVELEQDGLSPWDRNALVAEVEYAGSLQFVAEDQNTSDILGWCCGRWSNLEAELLKISVLKSQRKSGIASALLVHLIRQLISSGIATLFLEVRAQNLPALQLYHKHGFVEVGRRQKYYADPQDDALIFSKNLLYD